MPSEESYVTQDMVLGELRGQMREVVHAMNNLRVGFDQMSREIGALGALSQSVNGLSTQLGQIEGRLRALEAESQRSAGARSLGAMALKSPALAWVVVGAGAAWAWLKGWM